MSRFTLALDSTQLSDYCFCPTYWKLHHQQKLTARREVRTALDYGTILHGLLERYYIKRYQKNSIEDSRAYAVQQFEQYKKDFKLPKEDFDFLRQRFLEYTLFYRDADFNVIGRGGKPAVEVGFSYPIVDTPDFLFVLEGKIDLIAREEARIYFIDHKTQSRKYSHYGKRIQFRNYALAMGCSWICVNYIGTQQKVTKDTFRRELHHITREELNDWRKKLTRLFYKIAHSIMLDSFDENYNSCEGRFGHPCQFAPICEQITDLRRNYQIEHKFETKQEFIPWTEEEL